MRPPLLLLSILLACSPGGGSPSDSGGSGSGETGGSGEGSGEEGGDGGASTGDGEDSGGSGGDDTGESGTGDSGDTGTDDTGAGWCEDQPTVTYNNFGASFMKESCQGCHASTAPERYGAPESVTFDTVEQCWGWSSRILARSTGADPSMPPAGGVHEDDRLLLEIWLRCAEPGT